MQKFSKTEKLIALVSLVIGALIADLILDFWHAPFVFVEVKNEQQAVVAPIEEKSFVNP